MPPLVPIPLQVSSLSVPPAPPRRGRSVRLARYMRPGRPPEREPRVALASNTPTLRTPMHGGRRSGPLGWPAPTWVPRRAASGRRHGHLEPDDAAVPIQGKDLAVGNELRRSRQRHVRARAVVRRPVWVRMASLAAASRGGQDPVGSDPGDHDHSDDHDHDDPSTAKSHGNPHQLCRQHEAPVCPSIEPRMPWLTVIGEPSKRNDTSKFEPKFVSGSPLW